MPPSSQPAVSSHPLSSHHEPLCQKHRVMLEPHCALFFLKSTDPNQASGLRAERGRARSARARPQELERTNKLRAHSAAPGQGCRPRPRPTRGATRHISTPGTGVEGPTNPHWPELMSSLACCTASAASQMNSRSGGAEVLVLKTKQPTITKRRGGLDAQASLGTGDGSEHKAILPGP